MPVDPSDSVPGVDGQRLAVAAGRFLELPNIRAEPADRFAQAVHTLVEKRAQKNWPNEGKADHAVFVMVDHPRPVGEKYEASPFVDPIAKDTPLLGHLFFSNRDASAGRFMPIPTEGDAILEWLDDNGLGNCPNVIAYRGSKMMVTRRAGVHGTARSEPIRDQKPSATLSELMDALKHFHRTQLLTPTSCPDGVWERGYARQYVPGPTPEKSIQSALELALNSRFSETVKAESEDKTNIGRIDMRLLKKSGRGNSLTYSYWVVMELKIIRSFTNPRRSPNRTPVSRSDNIKTIVKGIRQAGSYQKNRSAERGFLEVYDLRKDKGDDLIQQPKVQDARAEFTSPPEIHVWPVFGSSEDARAAGYTGV